MRAEVSSLVTLNARDTVVLSSDGLFDNLTPDEVVALLRAGELVTVGNTVAAVHARMTAGEGSRPSKPADLTIIALRRA